jgi:hypothetical protein
MEEEIAHLRSLDLIGLKIRWQSVVGRPAPEHLPKHLLFGILAYRIQTDVLGDLNAATVQLLKRAAIVQSLSEVFPLVAAHAGWMLVKARYDDGGFSADRPIALPCSNCWRMSQPIGSTSSSSIRWTG